MSETELRAGILRLLEGERDAHVLQAIHDLLGLAAREARWKQALRKRAAAAMQDHEQGAWRALDDVVNDLKALARG